MSIFNRLYFKPEKKPMSTSIQQSSGPLRKTNKKIANSSWLFLNASQLLTNNTGK
ncbi:hypothetical protein PALB_26970 [Pseudoalteromonas luteoviolacea B = ATCC 29581]|nr:hypothetical protein PALB_26970 [Pseudoalteromonas luteoviolacea B = ATCC 29581]